MHWLRRCGLVPVVLLLALGLGQAAVVADALQFHGGARSPIAAVADGASAVAVHGHDCLLGSELSDPTFLPGAAASAPPAAPRFVTHEPAGTPVPRPTPSGCSHQSRAPPLA